MIIMLVARAPTVALFLLTGAMCSPGPGADGARAKHLVVPHLRIHDQLTAGFVWSSGPTFGLIPCSFLFVSYVGLLGSHKPKFCHLSDFGYAEKGIWYGPTGAFTSRFWVQLPRTQLTTLPTHHDASSNTYRAQGPLSLRNGKVKGQLATHEGLKVPASEDVPLKGRLREGNQPLHPRQSKLHHS